MRKFTGIVLTSVFCLLLSVPAYAGLGVSVTGGNWAVGTIGMGFTSTTTLNKWTVTGSANIIETVYIKVDGINWHPGSVAGDNVFVLKHNALSSFIAAAAITSSGSGIKLKSLGPAATVGFDLQFTAPTASTGVTGEQALTVTLTAKDYAPLGVDVFEVIDANFAAVGTTTGYLIWPRLQISAATNNDVAIQWKTTNTAGQPTWSDVTNSYTYPSGEDSTYYPAFAWAENLDYGGYTDWRLPTSVEEQQLYLYGRAMITYANNFTWSATECNATNAWAASIYYSYMTYQTKTDSFFVRAVRSSQ